MNRVGSCLMRRICGVLMGVSLAGLGMSSAHAMGDPDALDDHLAIGDNACAIGSDSRIRCWPRHNGFPPTSTERFRSMASGDSWGRLCAVRVDGEAVCRSASGSPVPEAPAGPWRMLAVAYDETCGIRMDGSLACWGDVPEMATAAPTDGPFRSVSIGWYVGCALRVDGTLACWRAGLLEEFQIERSPPGRFLKVEVSSLHACALRSDGRILCWGLDVDGGNQAPDRDDFIDLSVGAYHACGLKADGTVVCWGGTRYSGTPRPMPSPRGEFTELASGYAQACGRRRDGTVDCWGESVFLEGVTGLGVPLARLAMGGGTVCAMDEAGIPHCLDPESPLVPPPGRYLDVSLGRDRGCGIDVDHRVLCWGESLGPAPAEPMHAVSVGKAHACGLADDDRILCWGDDSAGQTQVTPGRYRDVLAGDDYSCGLSMEGVVMCWGTDPLVTRLPVGNGFTSLYGGDAILCAGRDEDMPECWNDAGRLPVPPTVYRYSDAVVGDTFVCWKMWHFVQCMGAAEPVRQGYSYDDVVALAASGQDVCALHADGFITCRGREYAVRGLRAVPVGTGGLVAGARHTCNVDDAGGVDCWGDNTKGQRDASVIMGSIAGAGGDHTCGTDRGNLLHCWGDGQREANLPPPGLQVRDVDVGQFGGCGIERSGDVTCWGWNANDQASPPTGAFRRVATGLNHSCGVRDDGTLACWGYGADGQIAAPAGTYLTVDVGERHSCAIAGDARLYCWGLDSEGQSTPPADDARYVALAVGTFHACAIRGDGALACWGRNDHGQAVPPAGRFVSVAAGGAHTCAVREDGARACWGDNGAGQAPSLSLAPATLPPASGGNGDLHEVQLMVAGSGGYVPRSPVFRVVAGDLPEGALTPAGRLQLYITQPNARYAFTVEVRDANGFVATRDYVLQVGPSADTTPPVIGVSISGPTGDDGWYTGDVHVVWGVDDPDSGIVESNGCDETVLTQDAVFLSVSCAARNRAGLSSSQTRQIKRDGTPPAIGAWYSPQSAPNAHGWFRASVHLSYTCGDATSGVAGSCPSPSDFTTEGVHVPPLQTVRDRAGNIATTSQAPIRIDWTAPLLDAVMPPSQLPAGTVHDYHATASDALSGMDSLVCIPVDSTPYQGGPGGPVERIAQCTATDRAGNATVMRGTYTVVAPIVPAKVRILRGSRLPALPARNRAGHRAVR